jgi:hypothetical protein
LPQALWIACCAARNDGANRAARGGRIVYDYLIVQVVFLSGAEVVCGVAVAEPVEGVKTRKRSLPEVLAALLDALRDALLVLRPSTLFVTDAEMIRRIGVPEKIARAAINALDENPYSGFPQKSEVWGNRRYWPAVEIWFQQHQGLDASPKAKRPAS